MKNSLYLRMQLEIGWLLSFFVPVVRSLDMRLRRLLAQTTS